MDITVQELQAKMENEEEFHLIDVRELHEHEKFNIGGTLIPLGDIMSALEDYKPHKEEEIVFYCQTGTRSAMAQQLFRQAGYARVRNLIGGVMEWQRVFEA